MHSIRQTVPSQQPSTPRRADDRLPTRHSTPSKRSHPSPSVSGFGRPAYSVARDPQRGLEGRRIPARRAGPLPESGQFRTDALCDARQIFCPE
jgi:hypothetical protein